MLRREFIIGAGAAVAWPRTAGAQQRKLPTLGFLGTVSESSWTKPIAAFEQRLRELGWTNGRSIAIDYRWADGRDERIAEIVREFVDRKVDIIVTGGNAVAAAKRATSTIPIVFALAVDPVGSGFVNSLSLPGGNVTGLSLQGPDLAGKRLEQVRRFVPGRRRLAILANVGYPAAKKELDEAQTAAPALGFEPVILEIRRGEDIAPAFDGLKDRADALYVASEALVNAYFDRIGAMALDAKLPSIAGTREFAASGGLMSYGPSIAALFQRAADDVDKILHGVKPADIPVEQPTQFDLTINLKTARALGLTIPESAMSLADEVIE